MRQSRGWSTHWSGRRPPEDRLRPTIHAFRYERTERVAISVQSLCAFAWVLDRGYKAVHADIAAAIEQLLDIQGRRARLVAS